ncbi:MAG: hypoxanthine phosphoribosyltransferase [Candidatus Lokiarchaeota archaeon]|nr:hypoxanthine phosphoribosyltransferase [Candidatus Lokiarchaeota archaeon]
MELEKNIKILIHERNIQKTIKEIAQIINKDYRTKNPILICVLKGACIFFVDLIRYLNIEIEIEFIELSSYGANIESSEKVKIIKWLTSDIENREIIIIEDIVDTGITIDFLINKLSECNPLSIKLCSLTSKPTKRKKKIKIDYIGFEIPDKFIIGYGFDLNEKYRNLRDIYYIDD